ncbi:MAG: tetraacyldisaccharide 4'-kinase, partial [Vampirovibrionia bacterium]
KNLDNVVILTGSNRSELAELAVSKYNCNLLILDDGFQHKKLYRDYDVLLIDQYNKFGNCKQLPLGPLREPISGLKQADIIIWVDKTDTVVDTPSITDFYDLSKPEFYAQYRFKCFVDPVKNQEINDFKYTNVFAFTGIGQPELFFNQIKSNNLILNDTLKLDDHEDYSLQIIDIINVNAIDSNSECLITTEKDFVKVIKYLDKIQLPIFVMKMTMNIDINTIIKSIDI